jgi:hypothetical protein
MTPEIEVRVADPDDGRELVAWVRTVGDDVVVAVGGGERPHVGCVVMAVPVPSRRTPGTWSASCSVLTIPPHKEEPMARGVATRLASSCGRVAVVTAGVHDDDLDRAGIESYLRLADDLANEVVRAVLEAAPST